MMGGAAEKSAINTETEIDATIDKAEFSHPSEEDKNVIRKTVEMSLLTRPYVAALPRR